MCPVVTSCIDLRYPFRLYFSLLALVIWKIVIFACPFSVNLSEADMKKIFLVCAHISHHSLVSYKADLNWQ